MTTRRTVPLEAVIEQYLRSRCAEIGLLCWKFTAPGHRGVPDRVVMGHDARGDAVTLFVELKRPGAKPRPSQVAAIEDMRAHGTHAVVADTKAAVDALLSDYFTDPTIPIAERDPCAAPLPGTRPPRIDATKLFG
ncbi:VRR-NUC domain-containing protein [Gordonia sp. 852002-51296_SCH5728562-b]|uniref:VRR-NUC domain-containing protein n=1 Tax=Gordonia sp. 852002-51296_SCH5728562-b TaxID=1834101 RepID=UPI0007E9DC46|nr:VRR-NUC domain-containing protein [Gordonia sp. 852002-51296_SCH5728562-b]OBA38990.1 nuclease [Gordonia sp. 852002-51296_SCH5728562-b]